MNKSLNDPLISIILPAYKVEDYLARAIYSIQAQTFSDFELLIVDDGSPDNSGKIAEEFAAKDKRISVFHTQNNGAPAARNYALQFAKGKYLYFMDGDDWAEPTMLTDMFTVAEINAAELVIAGFFIDTYYDQEKYLSETKSFPDATFSNATEFRKIAHKLFDQNLLYTPWNKLFLHSYIKKHGILFKNTFWDDFPFVLDTIRDIEKVCVIEKPYYHFIRARAESETTKFRIGVTEKRLEEDQWMIELYKHWNLDLLEAKEVIDRRYIERLFGCFENIIVNPNISPTQKNSEVRALIYSARTKEALQNTTAKSLYAKLMWLPLRLKCLPLVILETRIISFVKTRNTKLFAKLKANR
ncbi:MAG: glycosyltransferase family 2 protein [Arcanobacterium sp.]|nr:glycosyltransferase family 2 protein [Arcanobacterium sp.]